MKPSLAINEAIIDNQFAKALSLLSQITDNEESQAEITALNARYRYYQKRRRHRLADDDDLDIELNRIRSAILSLSHYLLARQKSEASPDKTLDLLQEIRSRLKATQNAYLAQCNIRNMLMTSLRERFNIPKVDHYYHVFSSYYEQMNNKELRYHRMIRGYTQHIIRDNHFRTLALLQKYPALKEKVPRLEELEAHLMLWKSKYESIFEPDESISLVYLAMEEGVQFPRGIEHDIKKYIASHS